MKLGFFKRAFKSSVYDVGSILCDPSASPRTGSLQKYNKITAKAPKAGVTRNAHLQLSKALAVSDPTM